MSARGSYRSALGHRDFRLLISAFAISYSGSWAYNVALAVWVFEKTGSAAWVGAITIVKFVPSMLFSPYAGVLAERFERARLMLLLDVASAAVAVALAMLVIADGPPAGALAIALVLTLMQAVYIPATSAITPQVVGEDDLAAANALEGLLENLCVLAGPALAAVLLIWMQPEGVMVVNAASFVVSALLVAQVRARSRPTDVTEGGEAGAFRQMLVGARAIVGNSTALILVAFSVLASFVYGTDTVLFVVLSSERLGTGSEGLGFLLAGLGVGGVLAAGLVNRLASLPRLGVVITVGMAVYCLPTLVLIWVDDPAVAFGIQVVRGAGTLVVDVLAVTALQRALPSDLVARVFGIFFSLVLGAISLGAIGTPVLLELVGLDGTLLAVGAGIPLLTLLCSPWLVGMDRAAVARLAGLAPRIALIEVLDIFSSASRAALERLADACQPLTLAAGEIVIRQGDDADALYVVRTGEVSVSSHGAGDQEEFIRTMGPRSYFGEIGLLARIPRTATVAATEPTELWRISSEDFFEALATGHPSRSLIEGARSKLRRTHHDIAVDDAIADTV